MNHFDFQQDVAVNWLAQKVNFTLQITRRTTHPIPTARG